MNPKKNHIRIVIRKTGTNLPHMPRVGDVWTKPGRSDPGGGRRPLPWLGPVQTRAASLTGVQKGSYLSVPREP